jgi:opacity protein-like surface antigen
MRKNLLVSAATIAIATSLSGPGKAADLRPAPVPIAAPLPVPTWGGWYGGADLGWVGARFHAEAFESGHPFPGDPLNEDFRGNGFGIGLHVGYNWQFGQWVYGLEVDGTGAFGAKNTVCKGSFGSQPTTPGSCTRAVVTSDVLWLSTIRGRLGMTFDRTLIYATGGIAIAGVNYRMEKTDTEIQRHLVKTGGVVGAGAEWRVGPALSVRLEGLYHIFNDKGSYIVDRCCSPVVMKPGVQDVVVVRLGVSWRPELY